MPHLADIRLKIIGYIIAYTPILAEQPEPCLVLLLRPAVLIAKKVQKHLLIHLKPISQVAGTMHLKEGRRCRQPQRPCCSLVETWWMQLLMIH
jgi:hypothetical protein